MENRFLLDLRRIRFEARELSYLILVWRCFVDPGFWIVLLFRIQDLFYKRNIIVIPWLFFMLNRILFSVEIFPGANIGAGLRIMHGSGIVIGNQAVIGKNATIYHAVTVGARLTYASDGWPKIGDSCLLGAGATLLGSIVISDNVKVGANSVVLNDIPSNVSVVGNPGKIIRSK
jgi:serine O-acetyltransferase